MLSADTSNRTGNRLGAERALVGRFAAEIDSLGYLGSAKRRGELKRVPAKRAA